MNKDLMLQYVKFVADKILILSGHPILYNVINPFDFMELISLNSVTNFFEKRNSQYQTPMNLNINNDLKITDDF